MKLFLILLAVVAYVSADDEWKPKNNWEIKTIRDACLEESHLTEKQLDQLKTYHLPNEEPVRKYLVCLAVKLGILSTDEGYNADRRAKQFKGSMKESDIKKVAEDCLSKHPKGDKEIDVHVYEIHTCFVNSEFGKKPKIHRQ